MKSMLIIASFIAVAIASPTHRALVAPGLPGPAPVIDESPIEIGPAIIEDFLPIDVMPVNPHPVIDVTGPNGTPLVQIVLNINGASADVSIPSPIETPVVPEVVVPGPVNFVDSSDDELPAVVAPAPVVIGTPELPSVAAPAPVVIGTPSLPEVVVPEPVIIGNPIIPAPVVVLPQPLN